MDEKLLSTDRPLAIYYALLPEITSYSKTDSSHCTVALSGEWKLIHTTIGTIDLKETQRKTNAGTGFLTELAAICPGHSESVTENIGSVLGRKVILKAVYREGLTKIIGNNLNGPKLYFDTNSYNNTERRLKAAWEHTSQNLYHT